MTRRIRFISAGAGSGKTFRVTQVVYEELAAKRASPAGVLATTFTRKAAAELRERVRSRLIEQGEIQLAHAVGQSRIGTVNSICGELLVRFAFEAGLATEQRVLDEPTANQLLRQAGDEVLDDEAFNELLAVTARLELDKVFNGDDPPWRVNLRDIVDKARANAIEPERLRAMGGQNARELLHYFDKAARGTPDAALQEAVQEALAEIPAVRKEPPVKKTDEYLRLLADASRAMGSGRMPWRMWAKLASSEPESGLRPIAERVQRVAERYESHPQLHRDIETYLERLFGLAADSIEAYARLKKQLGVVDFVDQERQLLDVFEVPGVLETLSDELDLLIVDEFQDTSPIQLALFLKLAKCAKQVVWVGDVKQAIYGFRGSDARLMNGVLDSLERLGCEREYLSKSWRSRPALVSLVNHLFGSVFPGIPAKEVALKAEREEIAGPALLEWRLASTNQADRCGDLASGISALVASRTSVVDPETRKTRPVRLGDIAILAKSNAAVNQIAMTLRNRGIPSATTQPGLLSKAESVLLAACLRRLIDNNDTLATAEIISLADCEEPETWLANRMQWLQGEGKSWEWREADHPIVSELARMREHALLLSPQEAVALIIARCGIVPRILQWQANPDVARLRLANVDRFLELAASYEDERRSSRTPGSLSGFVLWLEDLASRGLDEFPRPSVDAVQVLTHHAAKGLEWPVVVLCDLASDIRDRIWNVQVGSASGLDVEMPLRDRFVRYWPWPFGNMKNVPVRARVEESETGEATRREAFEEHTRLLYVSLTRARDIAVVAWPQKANECEWMDVVPLRAAMSAASDGIIRLGRHSVPFSSMVVSASETVAPGAPAGALAWPQRPTLMTARPPLRAAPSSEAPIKVSKVASFALGKRIDIAGADDPAMLGTAIHAAIAADLAIPGRHLTVEKVGYLLARHGMGSVSAAQAQAQLAALRDWIASRWPSAEVMVETPLVQVRNNGQLLSGRTDLLVRTTGGWILLDHKSTPQAFPQWEQVAQEHAGQLAAYRDALEAVTGLPVLETWLVLPVAAACLKVELEVLAAVPVPV